MNFSLTAVDYVICIVTLSASVALGLYLAVRAHAGQTSEDFFLAGRRLTWPIVGARCSRPTSAPSTWSASRATRIATGFAPATVELTTAICLGFVAARCFSPTTSRTRSSRSPSSSNCATTRRRASFFSGLMLVICIMTKMAFTSFRRGPGDAQPAGLGRDDHGHRAGGSSRRS